MSPIAIVGIVLGILALIVGIVFIVRKDEDKDKPGPKSLSGPYFSVTKQSDGSNIAWTKHGKPTVIVGGSIHLSTAPEAQWKVMDTPMQPPGWKKNEWGILLQHTGGVIPASWTGPEGQLPGTWKQEQQ